MNIKIKKGKLELNYKKFIFPGGEVGIKLEVDNYKFFFDERNITLIARIQKSEDFFVLAMVKDALQQLGEKNINLFIPYIPYARQDRICDNGESFSLKVFANLLNSLNFPLVTIIDPHSEVCSALINNVEIISQYDIVAAWDEFIQRIKLSKIVSPDSGSNKKSAKIAKYLDHEEFIRADKLRDLTNGNIKETIVYCDDFKGKNVVVIDDILDGGRTFIELAKVLKTKNCGKIILYCTHGIFSQGTKPLYEGGIDEIWTTNSFYDVFPSNVGDIKIFDIESLIK
jgi:ribose-phosphate pyrophosphokinase